LPKRLFFSLLIGSFIRYNAFVHRPVRFDCRFDRFLWQSRSVCSAKFLMTGWYSSRFYVPSAVSVISRVFVYSCKWKEVRQLTVVNLRNNESQDQLLKRFRKKIVKSGVLSTVRRKRWFVSKSEQRRMDQKKAIRRYKRRSYKDFE